jgi:hypothetical protein
MLAHGKGFYQDSVKHDVACNRKLIDVRFFNRDMWLINPTVVDAIWTHDIEATTPTCSPLPHDGFMPRASLFGYTTGTAKGGAPRARVAAYKVCWSALYVVVLAGFESANHGGADVIYVSFGQDAPLADDAKSIFHKLVTLGPLHAAIHSVSVICSADNSGSYDNIVFNVAPWVTIVAAATIGSDFPNVLTLGNDVRLRRISLESTTLHSSVFYPMVDTASTACHLQLV